MFPSGRWRGFWEAPVWGRRWMEPLELHFADGEIHGQGADCIGGFTFAGSYSHDGVVRMVKQYIGKHSVLYEGRVEGEGAIVGLWFIDPVWTGPFALMPIVDGVEQMAIHEIVALPVG
jgi:hypothetical protein